MRELASRSDHSGPVGAAGPHGENVEVQERKKRERRECNELELRLLRAPHGRVTVLPFTAQAGEKVEAETTTQTFDAADHPSLLLCRLAETETGCATLLHLWSELRTSLENGKRWLERGGDDFGFSV